MRRGGGGGGGCGELPRRQGALDRPPPRRRAPPAGWGCDESGEVSAARTIISMLCTHTRLVVGSNSAEEQTDIVNARSCVF